MSLVENPNSSQEAIQIYENLERYNGFEFELLLLAMLTGLGMKLPINQINLNMRGLMIQLNLSNKKLSSKISSALSFLKTKKLIVNDEYGYVPTDKGRSLGLYLVTLIKKNYSTG